MIVLIEIDQLREQLFLLALMPIDMVAYNKVYLIKIEQQQQPHEQHDVLVMVTLINNNSNNNSSKQQ
jgi:hypothetical protein